MCDAEGVRMHVIPCVSTGGCIRTWHGPPMVRRGTTPPRWRPLSDRRATLSEECSKNVLGGFACPRGVGPPQPALARLRLGQRACDTACVYLRPHHGSPSHRANPAAPRCSVIQTGPTVSADKQFPSLRLRTHPSPLKQTALRHDCHHSCKSRHHVPTDRPLRPQHTVYAASWKAFNLSHSTRTT